MILLTPFIAVILLAAVLVGILSLILEVELVAQRLNISPETARLAVLLFSCIAVPFQLLFIALLFTLSFWIHRHNWQIAGWLLGSRLLRGGIAQSSAEFASPSGTKQVPGQFTNREHKQTVQQLIASLISLAVFTTAAIISLAQFIRLSSLAFFVTVITAGLAWGARTLISDLLSGTSNIFEDNFDVGDKVEFVYATKHFEGIIEKVTVRLAHLRAPTGELIIVPHGELRVMRNYSRGQFSGTTVTLLLKSSDLQQAITILRQLAPETPDLLPVMIEPWLVLNREGELGLQTEITLVGKAAHRQGANLRLQMMTLAVTRLKEAGILLGESGTI